LDVSLPEKLSKPVWHKESQNMHPIYFNYECITQLALAFGKCLFRISVNIDQLSGFLVISPTCTCIFTNFSALKSIRIERDLSGDAED